MYGEGADPRNATLVTGQTVSGKGLCLAHDGSNLVRVTGSAGSDVCIGISAGDSTRDVDGALQTSAGALVSYYPLGGVLMVAVEALEFTLGDLVYASGSGLVDKTSTNQKLVGVYVGEGETATAGDLIPVNTASAVNA